MKLTGVILLAACLQVSARGWSQQITLSEKNVPLQKVFKEIQLQSGYDFLCAYELMEKAGDVSVSVRDVPLEEALDSCLKGKALTYAIIEKTVVIKPAPPAIIVSQPPSPPQAITVAGKITDEKGDPLPGAIIQIKNSDAGAVADDHGTFILSNVDEKATLVITNIGYESQEIKLHGQQTLHIVLKVKSNPLDELQVIAYGTTTQRLATGNVTTITAKDIEKQPVSNPLLALEGRVPGLVIVQNNGNPGTAVSVQVQGKNSMNEGVDPLYVIDGVPYPSELLPDNLMGSILGYAGYNASPSGPGSPLSFINPSDIESISVLKDADATSIYGSRAANGAILITTKRGKAGPTKVDINAQTGFGQVARHMSMMNTTQYLAMRREAIANDGGTITQYDYDLNGTWDTTRNADWQKELIGGMAKYSNLNMTISGGNANTQFLVGGTYNLQGTVIPNPHHYQDVKGDVHFNLNNVSVNQKFRIQMTGSYMIDNNQLPSADLTPSALNYAPDAPPLFNKDGSINWGVDSLNYYGYNPLAYTAISYTNRTYNLISHALLSYELLPGLELKSSFGYNNLQTDETVLVPLTAFPPIQRSLGHPSAQYGNNNINSWIVEPQATYRRAIGKGKLEALAGATIEEQNSKGFQIMGSGYTNDAQLNDINSAAQLIAAPNGSTFSVYKYSAVFGRLNYNWADKYIISLNARRDGSSRFGPANQFHNFASAAGAWVFSQENFFLKNFSSLSFGKLRASYGTTGNDQIGDYTFMSLYTPTIEIGLPYQGQIGQQPVGLPNPYLEWESTRKLQFGLDLGFFKDRILLNTNYAINRSSNQLTGYPLPSIAGFYNVEVNLPAKVQNSDWEFILNTINVQTPKFSWTSSFNLTIPRNKLIAFPGLANSSYNYYYKIGQPLNVWHAFHFMGVNDSTGIFQFADAKGGVTSNPGYATDQTVVIELDPKFYGGLENTISYKGFELSFLFEFKKQIGLNPVGSSIYPGYFQDGGGNVPTLLLDRWRKPGDKAKYQKVGTSFSNWVQWSDATYASDFAWEDASYIRLKNLSLSWQFPTGWDKTVHLQNARLYIQGQNLLTITDYQGLDPENQSTGSLPPLRMLTFGLQVVF